MITEYTNRGVCSRKTVVELDDTGIIRDIKIIGGCSGNTQGIMSLLKGMHAKDAIRKMSGINCNGRGTSCPDQVARALSEALEKIG